jgi:hypothetical protein
MVGLKLAQFLTNWLDRHLYAIIYLDKTLGRSANRSVAALFDRAW